MNELDGNLTLWNDGGLIELGWNKVRGPEFEPITYRIENLGSPAILDNKGRQPQLPVLYPMSSQAVADRRKVVEGREADEGTAILKAMRDTPGATFTQIEAATGFARGKVQRQLDHLASPKGGKLVVNVLKKWTITNAGLKAIAL
jgi:hypothetical protein